MSDGHISECILDCFEIERFVWRKLDINLDILISSPHRDAFTDITLYSTGNFSVLYIIGRAKMGLVASLE